MIAVAILIAFSVFRSGDVNEKTTKGVSTETGTSEEAADTTLFEDVTTTKTGPSPVVGFSSRHNDVLAA